MTSFVTNPGRSARVDAGGGVCFDVDRQGPTTVDLRLGRELVRADEHFAEMAMRALASVLGYEIGERHEC